MATKVTLHAFISSISVIGREILQAQAQAQAQAQDSHCYVLCDAVAV